MGCTGIYTLHAGGQTLTAWSLEELAELIDCALDAGDAIDHLRAVAGDGERPLSRFEFCRLVGLLANDGS